MNKKKLLIALFATVSVTACVLAFAGCFDKRGDVNFSYELSADGDGYYLVDTELSIYNYTQITIPDTYNGKPVVGIGNDVFSGCLSLTDIIIPDTVNYIVKSAFAGCSALTSITIPYSVTAIEQSAFIYCDDITEINYMGTKEQWTIITKNLLNTGNGDYTVHCKDGDIVIDWGR